MADAEENHTPETRTAKANLDYVLQQRPDDLPPKPDPNIIRAKRQYRVQEAKHGTAPTTPPVGPIKGDLPDPRR